MKYSRSLQSNLDSYYLVLYKIYFINDVHSRHWLNKINAIDSVYFSGGHLKYKQFLYKSTTTV